MNFARMLISAVEEPVEVIEDVVEEIIEYDINDCYKILEKISNKLTVISDQLDDLQETGTGILQLLQDSFLESLVAFLFILVCYETMKMVRGWTKGVIFHGRNR